MKEITFTIDGYNFSTVPNNSRCREQCCSEISDKTGKTYFWMREETGNKNWVLYNPNEYYVRKDSKYRCEHLHLSRSFKGKVRLPINASSCCGMFNGLDLAQLDFSVIDTFNIVDMSEMFDSCKLGKTFTPIFNTSNVKTMRMMFMDCEKTEEMDLSHFDVSKVADFSQMLSGCLDLEKSILPDGTQKVQKIYAECSAIVIRLRNLTCPTLVQITLNTWVICSQIAQA